MGILDNLVIMFAVALVFAAIGTALDQKDEQS